MRGIIEEASKSKSGKTLGLKIDGTWYMTKEWELENCVGDAIEFEPKFDEYQGKTQRWINDYKSAGGGGDAPPGMAPPPPAQSASARRETNTGRPDLNDQAVERQLLLRFVGNGLAARASDQEGIEPFAKILYKIGKDILNGRFDAITSTDTEYDDDIPY